MNEDAQETLLKDLLGGCLSRHFGVQDKEFHSFIADNADYIDLTTGDILIRQGEQSDAVYFLLSGHLRVLVESPDGTQTPVGEVGRGETVGELALFTGKTRGANVVAIRDSIVAKISGETLEQAIGKKPKIALKITRQIIERFERSQAMTAPPTVPVNLTFLPITSGVDIDDFVSRIANLRKAKGQKTRIIDVDYVENNLGGLDRPDVFLPRGNVSLALSDLELKYSGLFFAVNSSDKNWCHTAVHHSDEVVLVADANAVPDISEIETELLRGHENLRAQTTLILLHDDNRQSPRHTSNWLKVRNVRRHFHIRKTKGEDYARLNRILSGQATGLVLAGGGARGIAHLGVMTALGELGMEFDYIGGTSAGAIMGSFPAMGVAAEDIKSATRDIFMNSPFGNISGDYNWLPMLSLLKGQRARKVSQKAALDNAGAEIDMEDCWKTFFAIASNFTTHQEQVLSHGDLVRNVLASFSIPGLMPPVLIDGDLLFDGGSFNNFPVDQMRRQGARHIVGIDLLPDVVHKHELNNLPTTGGILRDKMRSQKAQRYRRLPSMPNTLLTASVITSMARQKKLRAHVDILFQPNTRGVSLLDWKKYDILFDRAKEDALRQLETIDETILNNFRQ